MSCIILGTEDTAGDKTKFLTSWGLCSGWRKTIRKKKTSKVYVYYVMISTKEKMKAGKGDKKCCGDYNFR